ncbi:MAG: hypothetical protein SFW67_33780 [Myxococcaceae bacterium]|nr:hypothetical protein [Myxococcaceae bacterium]
MTTTEGAPPEPRPTRAPSTFARAENASRRVLLVICAGAFAWGTGSLVRVELQELLAAPLDGLSTGLSVLTAYWVLHRLWFVATLSPVSWLGGRFLGTSAVAFVVPALMTGELLDLAVAFIRDGSAFESGDDAIAWGLSLLVFGVAPFLAYGAGMRAFERAQARSLADAASRKAEYDAFIAKAVASQGAPAPTGESAAAQSTRSPSGDPPAADVAGPVADSTASTNAAPHDPPTSTS